jgi:pilus assembly protein Flp/PilA
MTRTKLRTKLHALNAWLWRVCADPRGQDMIEYALMAALVALASMAASPQVTTSFSTIFSKINSTVLAHGGN